MHVGMCVDVRGQHCEVYSLLPFRIDLNTVL